ncbi:hypothetical protein M5689_020663 [Euphorbia peplus]|nr:hypothetical protein M5689_020663 [Euphorbia peplus]
MEFKTQKLKTYSPVKIQNISKLHPARGPGFPETANRNLARDCCCCCPTSVPQGTVAATAALLLDRSNCCGLTTDPRGAAAVTAAARRSAASGKSTPTPKL